MKKLFILAFILFATAVHSQVILLESYKGFLIMEETNGKPEHITFDGRVIITVDIDNSVIKIDNEFKDVFYVRYKESSENYVDNQNLAYTTDTYQVIDNKGKYCKLLISVWKDIDYTIVAPSYNNILYAYICSFLNKQL